MSGAFEIYPEVRDVSGWSYDGGWNHDETQRPPASLDVNSFVACVFGSGGTDWRGETINVPLRGIPGDLSPELRSYLDELNEMGTYVEIEGPGWLTLDEAIGFDWAGKPHRKDAMDVCIEENIDVATCRPVNVPERYETYAERGGAFVSRVLPKLVARQSEGRQVRLVFFWVFS